ncbi:MAG: hypothetical protein ACPG4X_15670 [Pikeienuella sp.]
MFDIHHWRDDLDDHTASMNNAAERLGPTRAEPTVIAAHGVGYTVDCRLLGGWHVLNVAPGSGGRVKAEFQDSVRNTRHLLFKRQRPCSFAG